MEDKLIEAAKNFLLVYFGDGEEKSPSDFDRDILGGTDILFVSNMSFRPRWNNTPFFEALSDLVEEDKIHYRKDGDTGYIYWMSKNVDK